MKKITRLLAALLVLTLLICSCSGEEKRKVEIVPNVVWVYDVEPQDLSHISKEKYEEYLTALENPADRNAKRLIEGFKEIKFKDHEYRMGIFTGVARDTSAPFLHPLGKIEREGEIDIEYIVMDNWEEVRQDIESNKDNGVTKVVLFNNSYDESIYKEMISGKYAELDQYMEEMGLYDEEAYDQAVMSAGYIDGEQYLIPILYNVSGMIHGEKPTITYENDSADFGTKITAEDYPKESLTYENYMEKLISVMRKNDPSSEEFTFISSGFYENAPDLFLMASGLQWNEYEKQGELFALLLEYLNTYQEYQASEHDGLSDQSLIILYQNTNERLPFTDEVEDQVLEDLGIHAFGDWTIIAGEVPLRIIEKTQYFAECSTAESIPFHSIVGLLSYSGCWVYSNTVDGETDDHEYGTMEYWPVSMMGEAEVYAAQPTCYAAVVDDGDTKMAVKVIQQLLNQEIKAKYGLSPCLITRETQLEEWNKENGVSSINMRDIVWNLEKKEYEVSTVQAAWGQGIGANGDKIAQQVACEQLREQLSNVATAQIPDRELVSIWQDTLAEASEQELSAEAGFELLCERMDAWYEE